MDEDAWKEAFQNELIIRGILHFWSLEIEDCYQKNPNWLQYTLCSFARFCCQLCGRYWASSKVHLLFQIKLKKNIGSVKMHIFKQKCKICNSGCYENPMFIPENIEIAMSMLFNRICERVYNIPKENMPSRSFIKEGRQDGPHDCSNCEACAHGICTRNRNEAFNRSNVAYYEEFPQAFHGTGWERGTSHRGLLRNNRNTQQYDQDSSHSDSIFNCCVIL